MKFHDTLNEKIWQIDNDNEIKPEVANKLKEIADAFIESLEIPVDAVTDCVITGSSASYNYTPYSDIDLHLKVDFDKVHEDCPVVKGYLNAIKAAFNSNHDIHIHGIPVEVYAEGINEDTVHNGLYSLWQAKWIDEPQKIPPTENDAAVNAKFKEIAEQIDQIEDSELAVELLNKVYEMRKAGLTEAGEFSTENLAFKKLRDEGYLQKLRDIKKAKVDKELSLEKRTESAEGLDSRCYLRILRDSVEYIKALYRIQKQERHSTTLNRNYIDSLRFICTIPKYSIEIETTQNYDSNIELSKNIGFLILNAQVEITKQLQDNDANIKQVTIVVPGINMTDFERAEIDKYGISESLDEDDDYEYDETDPEQCIMHKLIYWGNLKAGDSIKHITFHVYQDDMDDTYNELCDRHDNQIGLYATEKELHDQMELYTKQRIDAHNKQGLDNWEFIGVEFKDEDMDYYNSRNKYESTKIKKVEKAKQGAEISGDIWESNVVIDPEILALVNEDENIDKPWKYFYTVGEATENTSYFDSDVGMSMPDQRTWDSGYGKQELYDTFKACIDGMDSNYKNIEDRSNDVIKWPYDEEIDDYPDFDEIQEEICEPEVYSNGDECLLEWWCSNWEGFGPEYHEREVFVSRFIQVFRTKNY